MRKAAAILLLASMFAHRYPIVGQEMVENQSESFETAPVRPEGGDYVPPPFTAVEVEGRSVRCVGRTYDLSGMVPIPHVGEHPLLQATTFTLNGTPLSAPGPLKWTTVTPAVAIAERSWSQGGIGFALRHVVEYDGFVTNDLTLTPSVNGIEIQELSFRIEYRPEVSTLYSIPVFSPTWAGFWPKEMKIDKPIVGVWGGDDQMGFASYVATFRNWRNLGARVILTRDGDGPGVVTYRIIAEPFVLTKPITFRFGFIATPVRPPERRRWQLYSIPPVIGGEKLADCFTIWGGLSDHYATFVTNKPENESAKTGLVREMRERVSTVIAYTTYAHVEEGAVQVPKNWMLTHGDGKIVSRSIGGGMADRNRVFLCPGSREWVEWKLADLKTAIDRYGVDGFYVDTSYIIMPCANAAHDHGWVNASGERQSDFGVWSMREVWRRAYELLCQKRGRAAIYAHHKSGCPPALAGFTSASCDGEQYTGQSIKQLTLDAFRAQDAGRNVGPLSILINEYYRSAHYGLREKAEHHNPTESLMLSLPHDVLCSGYPGYHPIREMIALRDDLGLADAEWTPYYAEGAAWRATGAQAVVISSYRTSSGDTALVATNPTYAPVSVAITGPTEAQEGRAFVAIDVFARLGRGSHFTPGYRWERSDPSKVEIGARSLGIFAFIREPDDLPAFARQRGGMRKEAVKRNRPVPEGAVVLSDFDDPDWELWHDDGTMGTTADNPVDTQFALRIIPKPKHDSCALVRMFGDPGDWTKCAALTFWVRPEKAMPVACIQVRLRNQDAYTSPMALTSHPASFCLPAGEWTQLRYEFGNIPRGNVGILRIYYNKAPGVPGPFDMDEMMLYGAAARPSDTEGHAKPESKRTGAEEDKPVPD